jgi:hypothetical protein
MMNKMDFFYGMVRTVYDRTKGLAQLPTYYMVFKLYIVNQAFDKWDLVFVLLFILVTVFDTKRGISAQRDYIWTRPGKAKNMMDNITWIRKKMESSDV